LQFAVLVHSLAKPPIEENLTNIGRPRLHMPNRQHVTTPQRRNRLVLPPPS
jgi:hypothetical protein